MTVNGAEPVAEVAVQGDAVVCVRFAKPMVSPTYQIRTTLELDRATGAIVTCAFSERTLYGFTLILSAPFVGVLQWEAFLPPSQRPEARCAS